MKREIAEELARIACAGHDNRFTQWVGRAGQSSSPSSIPPQRRRHAPSNRQRTASNASSRQSASSSSGDPIIPLHLNVSPELVRKHTQGRKSRSTTQFVPAKHYQKEIPYSDLRGFFGGIVPFSDPVPAQWCWMTEPRKGLSTQRLERDLRFFDTWIVQGTETNKEGKRYLTLRSPRSNGLARVSVDYLKLRWNGFQDEDKKDNMQKELVAGKAFILTESRTKSEEAEWKRRKEQHEKAKEQRKRRRSSAATLRGAA